MDKTDDFRKFLKSKRKKDHVIEGLIKLCESFEKFLQENRDTSLGKVSNADMSIFES